MPVKRIRIGFVIDCIESPTGGTERQLLMLLSRLDRSRFDPCLISIRRSAWMSTQQFPFPTLQYEIPRLVHFSTWRCLRAFISYCRQERIDIIQSFFVDGNIFGTMAAHWAGVPAVISSRRNIGHWQSRRDIAVLKFLRGKTDYYLCNSHAAARETISREGIPPAKVRVIYNGINLKKISDLNEEVRRQQRAKWGVDAKEILVGALANLRGVKNITSLIKAAIPIVSEFPDVKFIVVGEGPDRKQLETLIAEYSLGGRFFLVGRHLDTAPCLAAFDIAVLPSSYESFSNSLIEYMAAGLPLVATAVGGNVEAIADGQEGLLYESGNIDALAASLRKLLTSPGLSARLAENAKVKAFRDYSEENCVMNHQDFYQETLEGKS